MVSGIEMRKDSVASASSQPKLRTILYRVKSFNIRNKKENPVSAYDATTARRAAGVNCIVRNDGANVNSSKSVQAKELPERSI